MTARLIKPGLFALLAAILFACSSSPPAKTPESKAIDTLRTGIELMSQSELRPPCSTLTSPSCCAKDLSRYFDENVTLEFFALVSRGEFCGAAYRELGAIGHKVEIADAVGMVDEKEIEVTFKATLVSSEPGQADCDAKFDRTTEGAKLRQLLCTYRKGGTRRTVLSNVN